MLCPPAKRYYQNDLSQSTLLGVKACGLGHFLTLMTPSPQVDAAQNTRYTSG